MIVLGFSKEFFQYYHQEIFCIIGFYSFKIRNFVH